MKEGGHTTLITSVQYEDIKMGNIGTLKDVLENDFPFKCQTIKINDTYKGNLLTDGTFFGIQVLPKFSTHNIVKTVLNCTYKSDEIQNVSSINDINVASYDIEIDSRVFEILDCNQFYTYIGYEINKYRSIKAILRKYYDFLTVWLAKNCIELPTSTNMMELDLIYYYTIRDYIVNLISIPRMNVDNIEEYLELFDSTETDEIITLARDIQRKVGVIMKYNSNPLFLSAYLFTVLDDLERWKNEAIRTMKVFENLSVTNIDKEMYSNIVRCLNKLNHINISNVNEGFSIRNTKMYLDFRKSGARRLEEDYYKTAVSVKTIQTKDDAMYILREINSAIRILDALINSPETEPMAVDNYDDLRIKYYDLRDKVLDNKLLNSGPAVVTLSDLLRGNYII